MSYKIRDCGIEFANHKASDPKSTNLITLAETFRRRQAAIVAADNLRNSIDSLLTWGQLTWEERGELTQAANAAELAAGCLRFIGPQRAVTIGF